MDTAVILDICAGANGDEVVIAAQCYLIPDAAAGANPHRPDHRRCWCNKGSFVNLWLVIEKCGDMRWTPGVHDNASLWLVTG